VTVVEIVLLLPASLLLVPLLLAGALGAAFAILGNLVQGDLPLSARLVIALQSLKLIAWVAAAALGMASLWALVIEPEERPTAGLRVLLAAGLLVGIVAALTWLYVMGSGRTAYDAQTWLVWIVALGGPLIVAVRHLILIAAAWRAAPA
jgi:hypothetical protein